MRKEPAHGKRGMAVGACLLSSRSNRFGVRDCLFLLLALFLPVFPRAVAAWDYEGHRLINLAAWKALGTNFPAFVFTTENRERISFLGGEPDRWRNSTNLTFKHAHGPDHYFDFEDLELYGLEAKSLTPFRYEFAAQLAAARALDPVKFPPWSPAADPDRTKSLPGFLPWALAEHYSRLKSACSYYKVFQAAGTENEISNSRQNVIYFMGLLGHYVADGAQPLHLTRHYNGWVGANPRGYSTNRTLHAWIDGGYLAKIGRDNWELPASPRSARALAVGAASSDQGLFPLMIQYLLEQSRDVEALYQLEKEGKFTGEAATGLMGSDFLVRHMARASEMLADLWVTAWETAPADIYLQTQLDKRKLRRTRPR